MRSWAPCLSWLEGKNRHKPPTKLASRLPTGAGGRKPLLPQEKCNERQWAWLGYGRLWPLPSQGANGHKHADDACRLVSVLIANRGLRQQLLHHVPRNVRQPEVSPLKAVGQFGVV